MSVKLTLLAIPPVAVALYVTHLHKTLSREIQCSTTPYLTDSTLPIPKHVEENPSDYVILHERASKTIPITTLKFRLQKEILHLYLRRTMSVFSRSLAAWSIWFCIKDNKDRATFDQDYIQRLAFEEGDRVCGAYIVGFQNDRRVVLNLDPPRSYTGPVVQGILAVEAEEKDDQMIVINHTVLWRKKGEGRKNVLETEGGRWMHGLMVKRLVQDGVMALEVNSEGKKE
jgi:hypothetical protein